MNNDFVLSKKIPDKVKIVMHCSRTMDVDGEHIGIGFLTTTEANVKTAIKWATYYNSGEPEIIEVYNSGFTVRILKGPGNSCNSGKLSFCDCLISKGKTRAIVGINTDNIIEFMQTTTFKNGVGKDTISFYRDSNKLCIIKDTEAKKIKSSAKNNKLSNSALTSKWVPGVMYTSPNGQNTHCYLCDLYKMFDMDYSDNTVRYFGNTPQRLLLSIDYIQDVMREYDLDRYPKLSEIKKYFLDSVEAAEKSEYGTPSYQYSAVVSFSRNPIFKYNCLVKNLPKRIKTDDKIELDIPIADYINTILETMREKFLRYMESEITKPIEEYTDRIPDIAELPDVFFRTYAEPFDKAKFTDNEIEVIKYLIMTVKLANKFKEKWNLEHSTAYSSAYARGYTAFHILEDALNKK